MKELLLVACGGAAGAVCRYGVGLAFAGAGAATAFPWGTLTVNIAGSFCIGLLWGLCAGADWFLEWGRAVLVIGFLGAFTTFSAFSIETVLMIHGGRIGTAIAYVGISVLACVLAAWVGVGVTGGRAAA